MTPGAKKFITGSIAALAIVVGALILLPGAQVWSTALALAAIGALVLGTYRLNPWREGEGRWVILIVWLLLAIGAIANIYLYTTVFGGTTEQPILLNPDTDKWYYTSYETALVRFNVFMPYSSDYFYAAVMLLTALSVVPMILTNLLCTLLTVVICGYIAALVVPASDQVARRRASTTAMIMVSAVCFFLTLGTVPLKDAPTLTATALAVAALTNLFLRPDRAQGLRCRLKWIGAIIVSVIILWFLRSSFLPLLGVGVLVCLRPGRRNLLTAVALLVVIAGAYGFYQWWHAGYTPTAGYLAANTETNPYAFDIDTDHSAYAAFSSDYATAPTWKRVALLPVVAGVQYFIPFFWTGAKDEVAGYTMVYAHMGIPWYLIGSLMIYIILFRFRRQPMAMRRLMVWGIVMYLVPAYVTAGLVSRYFLPMLPCMIPAAVTAWMLYRRERSFIVFECVFAILATAVLTLAHHIQYT